MTVDLRKIFKEAESYLILENFPEDKLLPLIDNLIKGYDDLNKSTLIRGDKINIHKESIHLFDFFQTVVFNGLINQKYSNKVLEEIVEFSEKLFEFRATLNYQRVVRPKGFYNYELYALIGYALQHPKPAEEYQKFFKKNNPDWEIIKNYNERLLEEHEIFALMQKSKNAKDYKSNVEKLNVSHQLNVQLDDDVIKIDSYLIEAETKREILFQPLETWLKKIIENNISFAPFAKIKIESVSNNLIVTPKISLDEKEMNLEKHLWSIFKENVEELIFNSRKLIYLNSDPDVFENDELKKEKKEVTEVIESILNEIKRQRLMFQLTEPSQNTKLKTKKI